MEIASTWLNSSKHSADAEFTGSFFVRPPLSIFKQLYMANMAPGHRKYPGDVLLLHRSISHRILPIRHRYRCTSF